MLDRSKFYLNGQLLISNDGRHEANKRVCQDMSLIVGRQQIYIEAYEYALNSELEITYSGPDTYFVRTVVGGQPFHYACDPTSPMLPAAAFTLCTFRSDPTSAFDGDCTPTVGIAHPRYPGPCAKAIGTDSQYFDVFSGGFYVPVLGSADEALVSHALITCIFLSNQACFYISVQFGHLTSKIFHRAIFISSDGPFSTPQTLAHRAGKVF